MTEVSITAKVPEADKEELQRRAILGSRTLSQEVRRAPGGQHRDAEAAGQLQEGRQRAVEADAVSGQYYRPPTKSRS